MNGTHTVLDHDDASSMVSYDLNIKCLAGCPGKTHTPLLINADTELAGAVSLQCLQTVAWWRTQKIKGCRGIQLNQLAPRYPADGLAAARTAPFEQGLGIFIPKKLC